MTDRKTLKLRAPADDAPSPPIRKKGRGWEISEKRLDALHERAREMRREPSAAQAALVEALKDVETGGFAFKRQAVIGSAIVDFACKPLMLVVALDGDADAALASQRDRSLTEVGYRIERLDAAAVLADPAAAAQRVAAVMRECWHARRARPRTGGGRPSPSRSGPAQRRDGR